MRLPACALTGADCPQSVSDRAAPSGRGSGLRKGCSRSAVRSATHPTHLETRTKESNARTSQRVSTSPHGAMKVKASACRLRWDPPSPEGGAPPASLAHTAGQVEQECVAWNPRAWVEPPRVQILVVVANIQTRALKAEYEKGSM